MTLQFIVVIFLAFCCMFVITGVIVGAIESLIKAIKTRRSAKNFIKMYNKMMTRAGMSSMTEEEEKRLYKYMVNDLKLLIKTNKLYGRDED